MMNRSGKSDEPVVPRKLPNKDRGAPRLAEAVEGRGSAKRNLKEQSNSRTQDRAELQQALARIRQVAASDKEVKFTTLWHHALASRLQHRSTSGGLPWSQAEVRAGCRR